MIFINSISDKNKANYWIKPLSIVLLLCLSSCIDEYWPEINDYENILVVDGMITNGPGPFRVDLSLSADVNHPEYIPLRGCQVNIIDDLGNQIRLLENQEGAYVSSGTGEKGMIGRSYHLVVETPYGEEYKSDPQELLAPSIIDTIQHQLETKQDPKSNYTLNGYQFYISTLASGNESTHYLWRLQQTYEYNSDFFIHFLFDYGNQPFNPIDSLYTCWISQKINDIFVFSSEGLEVNELQQYPFLYVSTETRALSVRYSLLVDQFTIGSTAWSFWNAVAQQNTGEASLYTTQLYQIRGNLHNISDEKEPVLGYFTVAGKDTKRIFVDSPPPTVDFNYSVCELSEGDYDAYSYIWWTPRNTWPLYVVRDPEGRMALPAQGCVDCRRKGGSIQKPEFWID